jgi:tetratricopeptide (TPR) repeat protein
MADILGIPYALLGISEALVKTPLATMLPEQVTETPRVSKRETVTAALLTEHEQILDSYINGYYHRHGQAALTEVAGAAEQVRLWLPNTREHIQRRGLMLITGYYEFGRAVACEQQQYSLAIMDADLAIQHAEAVHKMKPNSDLMATVSYRRGITDFEQEVSRINQDGNYRMAISYVDAALSSAQSATPIVRDFVSLKWGLVHAHVATSEKEKTAVRDRLVRAYSSAAAYREEDDIYAFRYNLSYYHLTYAEALIALGAYSEAIGELDVAEEMTPLNFPRRLAFIDALRATAYLGLGEFQEAVSYAKDALIESRAVKSEFNIARIAKVYKQLKERYKHSSDVTELGRELAKTHPHLV